jgi:hypothetical protein
MGRLGAPLSIAPQKKELGGSHRQADLSKGICGPVRYREGGGSEIDLLN